MFIGLAGLVYAGSLASLVAVEHVESHWYALSVGGSARWFYLPMLAWVCIIVWLVLGQRLWILRIAGAAVLVFSLAVGFRLDWSYPPLPPTDFYLAAARFDRAPAGSTMRLPIQPSGWEMTLTKRK
jgi:hypothetical protein